jgi:leucyl aminopeptidase
MLNLLLLLPLPLCLQAVVDIATLTGACIIALGGEVAGLFTPSDDMASALSAASNAAGEKLWRMPMEASYAEQLKSSVADMKNTGGWQRHAYVALLHRQIWIISSAQILGY